MKSRIRRQFQSNDITVVSIDVFDTLLLRDTTPETKRFEQISARQARTLSEIANKSISPADFYLLRREAARIVYATKRRTQGGREATWKEIFEVIFVALDIEPTAAHFRVCEDIELEYERERLSLNDELYETILDAEAAGKSVFCLSDMYLSSKRICELIDSVAGQSLGLTVWSSADHGFGKGCGALYRKLAHDLSVDYSNIFHAGDSWYVDFHVPATLGIKAMFLPRSSAWRLARKVRTLAFDRTLPAL